MNKQSKRKTRSFKSSILLLLLMAVLLISSTYAWFTANQTVTISPITVNVQATNGLQISTDGTNWKSVISNADLITNIATTYATNTNQVPEELAPVSTTGNVTSGKLDLFYGSVSTNTSGDYVITSTQEVDTAGTTGHYIVFDLFLRVDADTPIYITPTSQVKKEDSATDVGLQNAARMAFINEGVTAAGSGLATIQGLNTGTTSAIWEPNYDTHTASGAKNGTDNYGILTDRFTPVTGNPNYNTSTQIAYYGLKKECTAAENIKVQQLTTPNSDIFGLVTPTYSTINGFTGNTSFATLQKGITKYRVYMWIEGQDIDCENGASGTNIIYNLQFTQNNA